MDLSVEEILKVKIYPTTFLKISKIEMHYMSVLEPPRAAVLNSFFCDPIFMLKILDTVVRLNKIHRTIF